MRLVADTHAALWYLWEPEKLSHKARGAIRDSLKAEVRIGICSISLCELIYLSEKGRIHADALAMFRDALESADTMFTEIPVTFELVERIQGVSRAAVPDMPDRLISAAALLYNVPLVTCDKQIREAGIPCIW